MYDEYVPIYVPVEHLRPVHSLLASLLEAHPPSEGDDREWGDEVLARLYADAAKSTETILVTLASRPGEWLTAEDLGKALGPEASWRSVAGALSPLTKRQKRYGQRSWPFEVREDNGRYSYRMSERTATIILGLHEATEKTIDALKNGKPESLVR